MSLQLSIYPQNYQGIVNNELITINENLVDGQDFNTLNTSTFEFLSNYSSNNPEGVSITNAFPSVPNTWYKFKAPNGGPNYPLQTSNNIVFPSQGVGSEGMNGVYQRITNLNVGQVYTVELVVSTAATTGIISINVYDNNNTGQSTQSDFYNAVNFPANSTMSLSFTAVNTTQIILISYENLATTSITFSKISVTDTTVTPVPNINVLEDGQVICDLYEDEDIPLTLSVDDFKNVAEQVQSYSKAFKLPATKRNNQIFDNVFEITRSSNGLIFNPYIKTRAVLKQDGFILFQGYLKLIDINDKEGEVSYNINLYSEVIALADVLEERTFSELDFTELEHVYNRTNIQASYTGAPAYINSSTSNLRGDDTLKYPFVDWSHSFIVGENNFPELPNLEAVFRPFINIKYLIQRIFEDTQFEYTSDFIDNDADFKKLYMDFNWGDSDAPNSRLASGTGFNNDTPVAATTSFTRLKFDDESFSDETLLGYNNSTSKFTASFDNQQYTVGYRFYISWDIGSNPLGFQSVGEIGWEKQDSLGNVLGYSDFSYIQTGTDTATFGNNIYSGAFIVSLLSGESIRPVFREYSGYAVSQLTDVLIPDAFANLNTTVHTGTSQITTQILLQTLRGELGQWEFLKGIFTMFNLVSIPDVQNPNNILIEPYNDIFLNNDDSVVLDWTDKIDISQIKLTPLTDLNKTTIFKFVEDEDDYAFNVYKNAVRGHLYGSKVFSAAALTILEGMEEISAEPFAATVPKPLMSQYSDFVTPSLYSYSASDGTSEGFDNSPRIMFDNGVKTLTNCSYLIPAQNGVAQEDASTFLQFSHLTSISTVVSTPPADTDTFDFNFGECQLVSPIGDATPRNLFNTYWLPYFNELYNPDTRTMTLKVKLNAGDINTFKFYDTVFIKNREFRVNKIDYKPNDLATVEFILIP